MTKKKWIAIGSAIVAVLLAVVIVLACVPRVPIMSAASAKSGKESSKATIRFHEDTLTLDLTSHSKFQNIAGVYTYPEYIFYNAKAVGKDPCRFFMWNNSIGGVDDDMKNALYFAYSPLVRKGKVKVFREISNYSIDSVKWSRKKVYHFFTNGGKLTNYDYENGGIRYNVLYKYDTDGDVKSVDFSNSNGFTMIITLEKTDGNTTELDIYDSFSKKVSKEKWKYQDGKIIIGKKPTFTLEKNGGYLTKVYYGKKVRSLYTFGKGHRLEKVDDGSTHYRFTY